MPASPWKSNFTRCFPVSDSKALRRARRLANELEAAARSDPSLRGMAQQERLLARVLAAERDKVQEHARNRDRAARRARALAAGGTAARRRDAPPCGQGDRAARRPRTAQLRRHIASPTGWPPCNGGAGALRARASRTAYSRSYPLQRGLGRAGVRVSAAAGPLARGARELRRRSPASLRLRLLRPLRARRSTAGSPRPRGRGGQRRAGRAGRAAARRLRPIPSTPPARGPPASCSTTKRQRLAREGNLVAGVSGGAAILNDYGSATKSRLPLVIGAIVLITFLMLVAILRAPLLAGAGGLPQPGLGRRRGRGRQPHLQGPGGLPARRSQLYRHGRRGGDLRRHLRPLDRLRGLPPRPHARTA